MQHLRSICTVLLLALLGSGMAFSQAVNSTLLGTVTDSSGGAVVNAQVTIKDANTGISRTTKTGVAGNYVFSDVPPGSYSVTVEQAGFKKEVRSGVNLQVNETARIDLTLQLGNVTETVTITGEAALLQ